MLEELKDIDTTAIQELRSIKKEQETLRKRLDAMEKKRDAVSETVYERVLGDYSARYDELEKTAAPLKDTARAEYAKLKALIDRMTVALDEASLAKEELSFRHELGEFNEKDFKEQVEEGEHRIAQCEAELKEGTDIKAKFIAAFHSEEELEESLPPPPPAPTPPPPEEPAEEDAEPPAEEEAAADEQADQEPASADEEASAEEPQEAAPAKDIEQDSTALLSLPRLMSHAPDGSEEEYPLAMGSTTIGRLDSNDICIPDGTVSRHHARVEMTEDGFTIIDLESENGIFVNGERVTEHKLVEDDRIEVGPGTKEFVFKSA
jgi:hypothetical protein